MVDGVWSVDGEGGMGKMMNLVSIPLVSRVLFSRYVALRTLKSSLTYLSGCINALLPRGVQLVDALSWRKPFACHPSQSAPFISIFEKVEN